MVLSQFRQKVNLSQCSIYNFSRVFLGGDGEEGAMKVSSNLPKVSPKISPKFWQNLMSSKFKKKHNTKRRSLHQQTSLALLIVIINKVKQNAFIGKALHYESKHSRPRHLFSINSYFILNNTIIFQQ